jgi:DNA-directed RNA polymerase specialized sigma24 family protein
MPLRPSPSPLTLPRGWDSTAVRLFAFGLLLIALALGTPRLASSVVVALVVLGVSVAFVGATFQRIQELEIGPGGIKAKLKAIDAFAPILVDLDPDAVTRFAHLACGDGAQARELVEKALAKSAERRRQLPRDERDTYTLRRLIDLLDSAADRRWLHEREPAIAGPAVSGPASLKVIEALREVAFFPRVCFLLRTELDLLPREVSAVLECSLEQVTTSIDEVRDVIFPIDIHRVTPS